MADGRSSPLPPSDGGAAAPEEKKKMIGRYELGELLGEGTFSKVKKAVDSTNGNVVAIKIVNNALVQVRPRAPRLSSGLRHHVLCIANRFLSAECEGHGARVPRDTRSEKHPPPQYHPAVSDLLSPCCAPT
jgi:serine/threonine protein kinase